MQGKITSILPPKISVIKYLLAILYSILACHQAPNVFKFVISTRVNKAYLS